MAKFEIEWQAPEFEYREKDISWYWLSIIFAVIIIGFAVWQKNFLFASFIAVAEILILTWANRRPNQAQFKMTDRGLTINGAKFYPFAEIENFSMAESENDEIVRVALRFKSRLRPLLKISLPKNRSEEIQGAIKQALPQTDYEESLLDAMERFLGF